MIRFSLIFIIAMPLVSCQVPQQPAVALPVTEPSVEHLHHAPRGKVEQNDELDRKLQGVQQGLRTMQEQINPGPQ